MPDTLNWAVPLVGMTLVAAAPLRAGMVNLGGDGQLVIGGLVAALVPLYLPAPGPVAAMAAILAAMLASGLYASFAAWGENSIRHPHADLEFCCSPIQPSGSLPMSLAFRFATRRPALLRQS